MNLHDQTISRRRTCRGATDTRDGDGRAALVVAGEGRRPRRRPARNRDAEGVRDLGWPLARRLLGRPASPRSQPAPSAARSPRRSRSGNDVSGSGGVDAALGVDGTLAVAWTAGGSAHVAVGPVGQRGAQTDLPGANVSDVAVTVAADGTVTVAYRTKPAASSYELMAATAAPGAALWHADQARTARPRASTASTRRRAWVERSRSPTGNLHRATTPTRSSARRAPRTLARHQSLMTPAPTSPDIATRIAFDADGTIVAAWTNYGGAAYALRAPGAANRLPRPRSAPPARRRICSTSRRRRRAAPSAAWSAAGQIKAATKAPGAGFGDTQKVIAETSRDRRSARRHGTAGRTDHRRGQ